MTGINCLDQCVPTIIVDAPYSSNATAVRLLNSKMPVSIRNADGIEIEFVNGHKVTSYDFPDVFKWGDNWFRPLPKGVLLFFFGKMGRDRTVFDENRTYECQLKVYNNPLTMAPIYWGSLRIMVV